MCAPERFASLVHDAQTQDLARPKRKLHWLNAGGDLFVNTPFSDQPESPEFVVPRRIPGEEAEAYAARINAAAERLERADF